MTYFISEILLSLIGWIVLFIMYRDTNKMKKIRDEEYAGYYSAAGRIYILNAVAFTGAVGLTIILLVIIGKIVYDWFKVM